MTGFKSTNKINENEKIKQNLSKVKYKYMVLSGKGGVGKTTVAVNLAYGLALKDYRVGLLDVDIHGPNVPKMLGINEEKLITKDSKIVPMKVLPNLKVMSLALVLDDPDTPVIWRGPLKMKLIRQFLEEVSWNELDYLMIDSPPGTGDEPLSVCQLVGDLDGAIVVTTPQEVAILDVRKSIQFARELKIPYIGIIENMSGFICPYCHNQINLFKKGGGMKASVDLDVDFLGDIPFDLDIVNLEDKGKVFIRPDSNSRTAKKFNNIIKKIEHISFGKPNK